MSDAGSTGAMSARARFLSEVGERTRLLRELSDQLNDDPAMPAARGALRHRLQTLQVSAAAIGQKGLSEQAEAALACLQGSQDPDADDEARLRALSELRELIEGLPELARQAEGKDAVITGERPIEDTSKGARARRETPHVIAVTEELAREAARSEAEDGQEDGREDGREDGQAAQAQSDSKSPKSLPDLRPRRDTPQLPTDISDELAQAAASDGEERQAQAEEPVPYREPEQVLPAVRSAEARGRRTARTLVVESAVPPAEEVPAAAPEPEASPGAGAQPAPDSPFFEPSDLARSDAPGAALVLTQTVPGLVVSPAVATVLVLDDTATVSRVRNALPEARFEVTGARDPAEALSLIHAVSPKVVLVAQTLVEDPTLQLVERIRKDPISDVRHVLMLAHRATQETAARLGCDAWVRKPVEGPLLLAQLERLMGQAAASQSPLQELTEGTVDDIAQRLADEIRRGLSDSLKVGRDERIEIDDSAELMAAAWSAIGRVRSHLSTRSDGRVRFAANPQEAESPQGAQEQQDDGSRDAAVAEVIAGHRVLVVDDDPAVVWFFAGLLREAGAEVLEAKNGRDALELARLRRPHVIISDILMPKIDGFALCRELKRDVVLWDVPVILLSWKEDFLLRMRELQSGAAAYLRKEAGSRQILATVAETLKPRVRLRAQLASDAEVRGRIEQLSVLSVVELVSQGWPNAAVSVRDAYNLYEIQLRAGGQLSVTRTASDGTFARGPRALQQALGVRSGRFAVTRSDGLMRAAFDVPLPDALQHAAQRMGALLDAVSDKRLLRIGQVEFDDELLSALTDVTPASMTEFLRELKQPGAPLRERLVSGEVVPQVAEDHLRELARTGAITAVWDVDGNDLVADAYEALNRDPGRLVHVSVPPPRASDEGSETPGTADSARPRSDTKPDLMGPERDTGDIALSELASQPPSVPQPVQQQGEQAESADVTPVDVDAPGEALRAAQAAAASEDDDPAPRPETAPPSMRPRRETEMLGYAVSPPPTESDVRELAPEPGSERAEAASGTTDSAPEIPPSGPVPRATGEEEQPQPWERESPAAAGDLWSKVSVAASFIALAALGYFGFRALGVQQLIRDARASTAQVQAAPEGEAPLLLTDEQAAVRPAEETQVQGEATPIDDDGEFGRSVGFVQVHHGVKVDEGEGLLVIHRGQGAEAVEITVADRPVGADVTALALPEGRHPFVMRSGDRTSYRQLVIRGGETRIVDLP